MGRYTPGWRDRTQEMLKFELSQRRAQFLKLALPAFVIVLLTITFMWPKVDAWKNKASSSSGLGQRLRQNPDLKNKVFGPVFKALDKAGKPIEVQAEVATQRSQNLTDFDKLSGMLFLQDGRWIKFWADIGHHQKTEEILDLEKNVHIITQDGYDIITNSARILLTEKRGFGEEEVNGTGPIGETIKAEGFTLNHNRKTLSFTGKTSCAYPAEQKGKS
mgnify:CR=1 FL=1